MKSKINRYKLFAAGSIAVLLTMSVQQGKAADHLWDANGSDGGTGGSGTWDTTTPSWDDGSFTWNNTNNDSALFDGTPGTVAIASGGVAASVLEFFTADYILGAGNITLASNGDYVIFSNTTGTTRIDSNLILSTAGGAPNGNRIAGPSSIVINGVISGDFGIGSDNTASLTLNGANTYEGGTILGGATEFVYLGGASGTALGTGDLTLAITRPGSWLSGVFLTTDQTTAVVRFPVGLSFMRTNGHNLTVRGLESQGLNGVLENGGYNRAQNTSGNLVLNVETGKAFTYAGYMRDADQGGGSGKLSLVKNGAGTQTLAGSDITFTGGITVNAGILNLAGSPYFGSSKINGIATVNSGGILRINGSGNFQTKVTDTINVNGGGTLQYVGGTTPDWANLIGTINLTSTAGASAAVATADGSAVRFAQDRDGNLTSKGPVANTFGAAISLTKTIPGKVFRVTADSGNTLAVTGVVKDYPGLAGTPIVFDGSGTVILSAANTYAGTTTITGGAVVVDGSLGAASLVTVSPGGTLGGSGSVNGTVTVAGIVAPGTGVGKLTTSRLTLTGTYSCQIDGATADSLMVNGNLDLTGSTLDISVLAGGLTESSYVIGEYTDTLIGTFAVVPPGYTVDYAGGNGKQIVLSKQVSIAYSDWAAANGLAGTNNGVYQDPDQDGIVNVLEFILGSAPLTSSTGALPTVALSASNITADFFRNTAAIDNVALVAQWSTDLTQWRDLPVGAESSSDGSVNVTPVTPQKDRITVTIPRTNEANGRLFLRLKATP